MKYNKKLTKKFLYQEYINNKNSAIQIAKIIGCSYSPIYNYLKKYKIKTRTLSEAHLSRQKPPTKSFLIKEYIKNKKSMQKIAKIIDCSVSAIRCNLKKYNIKIRKRSDAQKVKCSKYINIITKNFLIKEYIKNKKSSNYIAKKYNCSNVTILRYLRKYNIKVRTAKEVRKFRNMKGKNNPMFGVHRFGTKNPMFGNKHSKKTKKKMMGKNNPMYGKIANHGNGSYYKQSYMRSTWEVAYAKYCIINHIKYRYEPKAFEIKIKDKDTTYTPDFYLPEQGLLIEIKGWWRNSAKKKFKAFKKQYPGIKIKVLMKSELQKLHVI